MHWRPTNYELKSGENMSRWSSSDPAAIAKVQWIGNPDLSKIERQVIRIQIRALHAELYSFFFPHGQDIT